MSYIDNVLIKLRREYSKDELVSALSKRLSEAEIENGKLNSYISELESKIELIAETYGTTNEKIGIVEEHKQSSSSLYY